MRTMDQDVSVLAEKLCCERAVSAFNSFGVTSTLLPVRNNSLIDFSQRVNAGRLVC